MGCSALAVEQLTSLCRLRDDARGSMQRICSILISRVPLTPLISPQIQKGSASDEQKTGINSRGGTNSITGSLKKITVDEALVGKHRLNPSFHQSSAMLGSHTLI